MTKITAKVIPYSTIVGTGITLHDETGAVIGQLQLRGFAGDPPGDPTAELHFDKAAVAFVERITAAINAGQPERNIRHLKKGQIYDVMAERALFQVSTGLGEEPLKSRLVFDGDAVTTYRNPETGMTFVRFPDEIADPGRFEPLPLRNQGGRF